MNIRTPVDIIKNKTEMIDILLGELSALSFRVKHLEAVVKTSEALRTLAVEERDRYRAVADMSKCCITNVLEEEMDT